MKSETSPTDNSKKNNKRKRLNSNIEEFHPSKKMRVKSPSPVRQRKKSTAEVIVDIASHMNDFYTYTHDFPRLEDYSKIEKIRETFPALDNINEDFKDLSDYENGIFFIMRSTMPDDIHKAMKYGVWTSTPEHNEILSKAYKRCNSSENGENSPKKVILFFRVLSENKLFGVAELTSDYILEEENNFWWDKIKWKGMFNLKWLYVNDINLNSLEQQEHGKFLYELTDCSKLSSKNGFFLLEFFKVVSFDFEQSLFKHFLLFDQREDFLLKSRTKTDFIISLKKCEKKIPFPQKVRKPSYHMTGYTEDNKHKKKSFHNNRKYSKKISESKNEQDEDLGYIKKVEINESSSKETYPNNKRKNSYKFNGRKSSYNQEVEVEYVKKSN